MAHRRERSLYLASLVAVTALVGCAAAPPKQEEATFIQGEVPTAKPDAPAAEVKPASEDELTADQKAQMEIALRRGERRRRTAPRSSPTRRAARAR